MLYLFGLVITIGFGIAIAALGGALGQGKAVAAALEGMARQPENSSRMFTAMLVGLAIIETLTIYTLVMGFMLKNYLPDTAEILKIIGAGH